MKLYLLTSSRADFGIYLPLIKEVLLDPSLELRLVVFGTHLSDKFGNTVNEIKASGIPIYKQIHTVPHSDTARDIAISKGDTLKSFANFWADEKDEVDCIICLGDRYEMFAAIAASVPFNLNVAHLHGGETTLGAIDNKYRHSLTLFSNLHFCSTEMFLDRISELTGEVENIHNVGALSIENIEQEDLYSIEGLKRDFGIDFSRPTILTTFHPETVSLTENEKNIQVLNELLPELLKEYQMVITLPNADTDSNGYRAAFLELAKKNENLKLIEHFGRKGYFSALKFSAFVFGNSSSGIIEAASLNKYVINVGNRQRGRASGKNVLHCKFDYNQILNLVKEVMSKGEYSGGNIYQKDGTAKEIIKVLKASNNVE